jgi:N-acetylmuramoyl-L-alanine amidase
VASRALNLTVATLLVAGAGLAAAAERAPVKPPAADPHPVATDTRLGGDENQTRFVMDLTRRVELRAFALADPYRVVVDLPQVTFKLPPNAGQAGRGLIKAFRFGLVMAGGSRIVLDLARPLRIPSPRPPAPVNKGDTRPVVVVDPGHGGVDWGTQAKGITEKAIVLEFSLILRDLLEKTGKYRVVMTRSDDTFVPLGERVQFARERQAALFISIHADALRRSEGEAQGATVYTLSETASDAEAARLAENENRADVIAGIDLSREPGDVADILIDLAQRETKTFSTHFAKNLVGELKNVARLHKFPLKSAGFKVLKAPDVPSVLLELGYVSSAADLKLLTSRAWQTRTASSIVQAIDTFFSTRLAGSPPVRP